MLRELFVGKAGLRSGWSALLFVALYQGTEAATTSTLRHFISLKPEGPINLLLALSREACELFSVLLATWTMSRIEGRSLLAYGFQSRRAVIRLAAGAIWGFLGLSALIGTLWKMGALVFEKRLLAGAVLWEYALGWLLVFTLVGFFEESLLRGYLQYRLGESTGFWGAAFGLSVAFALLHRGNQGESLLGLMSLLAAGLAFCMSLWYTRSLWWAVGLHVGWDWGESYFYGTPNSGLVMKGHLLAEHPAGNPLWSGGKAGPEASLLALPLFILVSLAMWIWWRKGAARFGSGGIGRPENIDQSIPN